MRWSRVPSLAVVLGSALGQSAGPSVLSPAGPSLFTAATIKAAAPDESASARSFFARGPVERAVRGFRS